MSSQRATFAKRQREQELKDRGARYSKAAIPFGKHVVEDGQLITGQNPASARGVGLVVAETEAGIEAGDERERGGEHDQRQGSLEHGAGDCTRSPGAPPLGARVRRTPAM